MISDTQIATAGSQRRHDEGRGAAATTAVGKAIAGLTAYSDLTAIPDGANLGLGCGNPQAIAGMRPGETVIDLGYVERGEITEEQLDALLDVLSMTHPG